MSRRKDIRLRNDFQELQKLAKNCSWFELSAFGNPPHTYDLTFRCIGLMKNEAGRIVQSNLHRCKLSLGSGYPTQAPNVTWRTPIFHPNIRGQAVCHSKQWAPSWSLADFVAELSDMIRYDKVNNTDPLDREAAHWASQNSRRFPVDKRDIRRKRIAITIKPKL